MIKILIPALLIGSLVACGQAPNDHYDSKRVVRTPDSEYSSSNKKLITLAANERPIIFANAQPDGQYCFYESDTSVVLKDKMFTEDNCELLNSTSIARKDLSSTIANNSRWANIMANFTMMPAASSLACLASMLVLVNLSTPVRVLLCTGMIASIGGSFYAIWKLAGESVSKTLRIISRFDYAMSEEDYDYLRKTFTVLQSSNSTPCPRLPQAKKE
ncbi:MAG: hypothetical protein OYH77_00660 [Pseudomonadota bacterium]|nr:hypothetical protein [Pseudomonadota bacterium]